LVKLSRLATLEWLKKVVTSESKEKGGDIWLRLHNNARFLIEIPTLSACLKCWKAKMRF
jgi:hypothetical protein